MEGLLQDNGLSLQIKKEIEELVKVAKGEIPADLILRNGRLVNVYTGEIIEKFSVVVKGKRIACIGKDLSYAIGSETKVIEVDGMLILPGFIDAHTHLLMYSPLHEVIRYALKSGTTTIISEAIELGFPYGVYGIKHFLNWIEDQPIKIYVTVPVMHSISPVGRKRAINKEELEELLRYKNVLGLGETIWNYIINKDKRTYEFIAKTLAYNKLVEGHGAGAKEKALCAFASCGISSCHESISVEDVCNRLRLGIYAMIREGDIRKELEQIAKIKDMDLDLRRCILVSDGVGPSTLIEKGYMNHILQKAIKLGFDPIKAVQMVTINPAEHFRLDQHIGGIASYRYADIVVVPDFKKIEPKYVISNGKLVVDNSHIIAKIHVPAYIKEPYPSVRLPKLSPSDFIIYSNGNKNLKARVIKLVSPLITRDVIREFRSIEGQIKASVERDIVKVAAITTDNNEIKKFVGLIEGLGLKRGAIATSAVWDACLIVVVGVDEKDMAEAVNKVVKMGGGVAISENGESVLELSMPIGGIIADMPIDKIAEQMKKIQKKASELGCRFPDTHLTISTLTTPYIPFIRISEDGIFDLKQWKKLDFLIT